MVATHALRWLPSSACSSRSGAPPGVQATRDELSHAQPAGWHHQGGRRLWVVRWYTRGFVGSSFPLAQCRVLIIGGSFAGLSVGRDMKDRYFVTIVVAKEFIEYTWSNHLDVDLHVLPGDRRPDEL